MPRTRSRYSAPTKNDAHMPQTISARTPQATIRLRSRRISSGRIGLAIRRSTARNPASSATATAVSPSVRTEPSPYCSEPMIA